MAKRSPNSPRSLFGEEERVFYATNRANVLSVLSSGLIRPRSAYEKYYDDLLALCPGHLLLFRNSFPQSLIPLLSGSEAGIFPVLVELDPAQLGVTGPSKSVRGDLTLGSGSKSAGRNDSLCEIVDAPIPISAVRRLCFLCQDDLDDFQARDFGNVLALPPLAADSSALSVGGPDPERFQAVLQELEPAAGSAEDFRRLDAALGAIAMLALLLPQSKPWVEAVAAAIGFPKVRKTAVPGAPDWLKSLVRLTVSPARPEPTGSGVDARLIAAAIDLLRSSNSRGGWVEAKVASDIASRASAGATPDELREIESWRDVVVAVAKADKQVGSLDDSGSIVRRGLMLLVLRCQPDRIIRAGETALRPGPQVTAVAGLLSGLFHGYSRLSRDIKSRSCAAGMLSRLALHWWSDVDGKKRKTVIATETHQVDSITTRISLVADKDLVLESVIRPDDSMMRLFYHAKGVGYRLDYDPEGNAFVYRPDSDGTPREILLEAGKATPRGQATFRVRTVCHNRDGKPVRLSKREDAIALLERNHDPVTQCRFAVEPATGNVEVLAHQLLETMDSPELQSHVEAVGKTAQEFETAWANRPLSKSSRAGKAKSPGIT